MSDGTAPASSSEGAGAVHTRTYAEYHLSGQPNGDYPRYEHTVSDPHGIAVLMVIWEKIQSGEYPWTDVTLRRREVTIIDTPWVDISDMRITREERPS